MDNKLSELSKPVGYAAKEDIELMQSGRMMLGLMTIRGYGEHALYSQEYVSALLAELEQANKRAEVESVGADKSAADCVQWMKCSEAADQRIAELEAIATEYAGKFQKAQDAAKHLIIMNDSAQAEIAHLKTLLATPVRLPEPCVYEVNSTRFYDRLSEAEVIASLREQGFTVEGDE